MHTAILFYVVSLIVALSFFWVTNSIFTNYSDKGYAFSRTIGFTILTYIYWISLHANQGLYVSILILLLALILGVYKFIKIGGYKNISKEILTSELIFITFYVVFLVFRSINPRIEGIEKMMDMALINSIAKSEIFPTTDVWYATKTINYYYFGHITPAIFIKILHLYPGNFYNVYLAGIFATIASTGFSLGLNLTKKKRYGLLLVFFVLFAGNLDLIVKKFQLQTTYYYAEARSLIEYAITEFPSYSFLISDLHAHLINIPNVILVLGLLFSIVTQKKVRLITIGLLSFILGITFVTNSWDYLIYMPLSVVIINTKYYLSTPKKQKSVVKLISSNAMLLGVSLILFIPFHLNFDPAVGGFGVNKDLISLKQILLMFGAFFVFTVPFILTTRITKIKKTPTLLFITFLTLWGYLLVVAPQFIFLKDIYYTANPSFYKANTVFKVWYQAWIVLSISSTYSIFYVINKVKIIYTKLLVQTIFITTIVFIAIYPINGVYYLYRTNKDTRLKSIDGYKFLEDQHKNELDGINWFKDNIKRPVIIVEKPGEAYTTDSLFSTFTGNPTLVGWSNHEFGWRGNWEEIAKIISDIQTLYTSGDTTTTKSIVDKYKVDYIIIGPKEKQQYGQNAGLGIKSFTTNVYKNEEVEIYKVKR